MEIYKITNTVTNKSYIGMSVNSGGGFGGRVSGAVSGVNRRLYDSMRCHGIDEFALGVVGAAESREDACQKEKYWISFLGAVMPNGCGVASGGDGGFTLEKWSDEDRKLLCRQQAEARRGIPTSDQKREKLSKAHSGKIITDEQRRKISETLEQKGCEPPDEYKWKKGQVGTFTGKNHTTEAKTKMSEFRLGKSYFDLYSEEHAIDLIERMRVSFMGENNPRYAGFDVEQQIKVLQQIAENPSFEMIKSKELTGWSQFKVRELLRKVGISNLSSAKKQNKGNWYNFVLSLLCNVFKEGDDVSELLGIVKYNPPLPAQLVGQAKGNFPSSVPRTDQNRIQNIKLEEYYGEYEVTEKLEGSSCTFYLDIEGNFEVCSRNLSLKEDENNSFWKTAHVYNVKEKMLEANLFGYAIQGELVGEGIQGNIYNIKGIDFYVYDVYDTKKAEYLSSGERITITTMLGLKHVPILCNVFHLDIEESKDDLLSLAESESKLNQKQQREGIVFKNLNDTSKSFKAISNKYLLKAKD